MASLTRPSATADVVRKLEPVLRAHSDQAEAERRLAPETVAAMLDAGVFQSLVPRGMGGDERTLLDSLQLFEGIARVDAAAGWIAGNQSGIAAILPVLPEETAAEMVAGGRSLFAGALFPPGAAIPVDGGYRVTGQWPFGSGSDYATWMVGNTFITENGAPKLGPDGNPIALVVVFPKADAELLDTWHTLGMRGTGSKDVRLADVFVPARRTWALAPFPPGTGIFAGPLYRLGFWIVGAINGSIALGVARAALDDLTALAAKTPAYLMTSLGDRQTVQDRVARATALLGAARSYLYTAAEDAWDGALSAPQLEPRLGIELSLAGSFAMDTSCQVVDLVHACAGTSAIRNEQRFQQYFRDIHTLSQHAFSSASRYESLGKLLMGRETDWAFYTL